MKFKLSLVVLLACLFPHAETKRNFGNLPLRFEPATDRQQAKFLARGSGYTLFLTEHGAILKSRSATIRMKMAGGNPSPLITPQGPLPGATNYLIGNDPSQWRTGVAGFARVEYRAIYPGIDLVYYGNQQQLEYDFVVAPGADPRQIRLAFDGAKNLQVDQNGDLVMRASGQTLRFRKPVLYQEVGGQKESVAGHYTLHGRQVAFTVSSYDASRPLVIDPVLVYSTFFGGPGDGISAIAIDAQNNVYLAGTTAGTVPTLNPEQPTFGGATDAFVTKMNAAGTALIYSTFIGGNGADGATGIVVDSMGSAYVTGGTASTNFPTVNPIQSALRGPTNAFVTKLNAAGSALVYSTYLGGSGDGGLYGGLVDPAGDAGIAIALDSAGNAYVMGRTYSPDFPTVAPFQSTITGIEAAFVTKINAAGSALVYSTFLGGSGATGGPFATTTPGGIAVDSTGSAYVTGYTCSSGFPTVNPFQASNKSSCNAFVTKFAPSGSALVYSTYLGGSGFDVATAITIDSAGNAYITGNTRSGTAGTTPFPTVKPLQAALIGQYGGTFVTELDAAGSALVYSTYFGNELEDAVAVAVDSAGNTYFAGRTGYVTPFASQYFPLANAIQTASGNAFLAKISPTDGAGLAMEPQNLNFSQQFVGGPVTPQPVTLIAAGDQPLNIAGITTSGDFAQTNTCGAVVTGGATCTVNVTFSPTASGTRNGTLTINSNAGSPRVVSLTGIGLIPVLTAAAQNAASFSFANVAGSIASVFGSNLAFSVGYPGATVTVTGSSGSYPAKIFYQSPTQINFQIPWEVAGSSQVTLTVNTVSIPVPLSATAPGIFTLNSQGTGPGAILNASAASYAVFAQPAGSVFNAQAQPVSPGQYISVYATGLGALTTPPPADGLGATGQVTIAAAATVSIGGVTVTPSFAGLAPGFAGLYQVNAQVPANATTGNAVPVFITVGGVASNVATIAVQ